MFEITGEAAEVEMIDFGRQGKVLFQLPVLGGDGVPMGVMSAFGIFYDKFQTNRNLTDSEAAQAWSFFIQVLADSYPDATRQLAMLDEKQFQQVITAWVQQSNEKTGFDPKAR